MREQTKSVAELRPFAVDTRRVQNAVCYYYIWKEMGRQWRWSQRRKV